MNDPPSSSTSIIPSSRYSGMPSSSGRSTTPDSVFSEATTTAFTPLRTRQLPTPGTTPTNHRPTVQDTPRPRRKQRKERIKPSHQPGVTVYPLTFPDYHDVYTYSTDVSIISEMLDREARRIHMISPALFDDLNRCTAKLGEAAQRRVAYLTNKWKDYRETGEMKFQFTGFVDDGIDQFARALEESTRQYLEHLKRATGGTRRYQTTQDHSPVPVRPFTPSEQDMYWTVIRWKGSLPLHMQEYDAWRREYETAKVEERRGRTAWGNRKRTTTTAASKIQQQDTPSSTGTSHSMKRKGKLDRAATLDSAVLDDTVTANGAGNSATPTSAVVVPGLENHLYLTRRYGSAPVGLDITLADNDDSSRQAKKRKRGAVGLRVAVHSSNNVNTEIDSAATGVLDQDMELIAGNEDANSVTGVSAYFGKAANEVTVTELTVQQVYINQPLSATASSPDTPTIVRRTRDLASSRGTPASASKKYGSSPGIDPRSGSQRLGFTASKSSLTSSCSSNADSVSSSKREKSKGNGKARGRGKGNDGGAQEDNQMFAARPRKASKPMIKEDVHMNRYGGYNDPLSSDWLVAAPVSSNKQDGTVSVLACSGLAMAHGREKSGISAIASTEAPQFNEDYWAQMAEKKKQNLAKRKSEIFARAAALADDNDSETDDNDATTEGPRSLMQNPTGSEGRASGLLDGRMALHGGSAIGMVARLDMEDRGNDVDGEKFEFATPSFPNDLLTSTPKTTMLERLSQTDNDDDTPDIPQASSSAGRPVWESESYPSEPPRRGKPNAKDLAAANDGDFGEGRRVPMSVANGFGSVMAANSHRTVSASSLTGVMDDLAGGRGGYDQYTSRTSPPGVRTRIGNFLDDDDNDDEVRDVCRAGWNVASSPFGEDVRSSGLRATQRIQRMGEGVMLEMSELLGQELVD